ncbi:MAG: rhomboid family intramembrane serine protease [Sporocytophaga sp.]|uniref:rhomboid family protein n=1 Tax=Sporocytophaga sp. TaxID=2231183 RepID=UPI001B236E40|nr:rhomboid family intramembrane serine protease [Sporocytophaga sp.]MBO9701615.1 rhomboid family intramembrane serine protease [Sporocytophaga sp.]
MNLLEDLKYQFRQKENGLTKIILINVIVYLIDTILWVFSRGFENMSLFNLIYFNQHIPPIFTNFLHKPWTLFTYFFSHDVPGPFHILGNMLGLYWFGRLITEYLGNRRLISLYILGGIAGAVIYLLLYNFVPYFIQHRPAIGMVGASASVFAITVAAATLLPEYYFHLVFIGPVKIKYIAAFFILISFIGSVGMNAGGNLAHLGGALLGYVFIKQLKNGRDLGKPISAVSEFINKLFTRRKFKVSYRSSDKNFNYEDKEPDQKEIDAILDKISKSGYSSLTKREKERLFRASSKK